jgi:3-oxoacyl-[acyl-carrier protein] reductase
MITRQYGRIVNISSRLTRTGGYSLGAAYGASKAGLDYLTKATAVQGAQYGVTCNGVSPYAVDAGMALTAPVDRESVIQGIPVRRYCSPEEIGHAVLYFASPAAGFVTGQTLHINGGTLMVG